MIIKRPHSQLIRYSKKQQRNLPLERIMSILGPPGHRTKSRRCDTSYSSLFLLCLFQLRTCVSVTVTLRAYGSCVLKETVTRASVEKCVCVCVCVFVCDRLWQEVVEKFANEFTSSFSQEEEDMFVIE